MKILHVIGQRPEKTGSGIYLQAIANESKNKGLFNYMVAGVSLNKIPRLASFPSDCCQYVHFESDHRSNDHLGFPVTGMSDVMPYKSSLFKELKDDRLDAYKIAFSKILQKAVDLYRPDIIHTHHLLVLTALTRKLFPNLPIVATCHGTDLRQYNNCDHLRDFVKKYCRQLDRTIALTNDQKKKSPVYMIFHLIKFLPLVVVMMKRYLIERPNPSTIWFTFFMQGNLTGVKGSPGC